jgi:PmbA protein
MNFDSACKYLLERAKAKGVVIEVYALSRASTGIKAFEGEVSEFKLSKQMGLSIRALVNQAWGYSFTEHFSKVALDRALEMALQNAELVEPVPHATIGAWAEPPHVGDLYGEGLSGVSVDRKVQHAIALEVLTRQADERVKSVPYSGYSDGESETVVANTAGLERSYKSNYAFQYVSPLVSQDGQNKSDMDYQFSREFERLDPTVTALEAVRKSLAMLGGRPAPSGSYPVVIDRECLATFLGTFAGIFSAKQVQDGKSPLAGKLQTPIGSSLVNLVDDATRSAAMQSRPFDDEGFPSQKLVLLERGVLKAFMHNTETAAKAGVLSTGHGSRVSYRGTLSVAPSNFYLEPGTGTRQDLMTEIAQGVLLTKIHGYHAGANPINGDFSLQADGFWIENGVITHPLEVFTVAGNFLELLQNVQAVANDLKFSMGGVGGSSVRVSSLNIGGQ